MEETLRIIVTAGHPCSAVLLGLFCLLPGGWDCERVSLAGQGDETGKIHDTLLCPPLGKVKLALNYGWNSLKYLRFGLI